MKAIKCSYNPDTFIVTATNGRRYTVKGGSIIAHRYREGRVIHVGVDGNLDPLLVRFINEAVEAATTTTTPGEPA